MKGCFKSLLVLIIIAIAAAAASKAAVDYFINPDGEATAAVSPVLLELAEEYTDSYVIEKTTETVDLPSYYDYRDVGRSVQVRSQGQQGTCWAFAALTALETTLMPETEADFSRDHLNYHNSYNLGTDGGSFMMSIAYLTAWQGPVYERDDAYGDGFSPDGLTAVMHVQEVCMPADKDYETIKRMVYLYGGVESSIYLDMSDGYRDTDSYSVYCSSYYYSGEAEPNHDVVIIGWDDDYPAENFQTMPEGDGAFICQNSWGTDFGDDGIFYVSYYDTNIGTYNAAYTVVESSDNYDLIFQSDLCGYTGQLGYNSETAYFANVYEADADTLVRAAGFYATGSDTKYRIGVVTDYDDVSDLSGVEYTTVGYIENAGYYTIVLDEAVTVAAGESFAVVVQIYTPDSSYPIAVEYALFDSAVDVDLSDGEGYVSSDGTGYWESTEENHDSNVCLKVYADIG